METKPKTDLELLRIEFFNWFRYHYPSQPSIFQIFYKSKNKWVCMTEENWGKPEFLDPTKIKVIIYAPSLEQGITEQLTNDFVDRYSGQSFNFIEEQPYSELYNDGLVLYNYKFEKRKQN